MIEGSYIYMKWCWENGIKIYPTPITPCGTKCKITIDYGSKVSTGTEVYDKKKSFRNTTVLIDNKSVSVKTPIPGLYDKILELYKAIYLKNNPENE